VLTPLSPDCVAKLPLQAVWGAEPSRGKWQQGKRPSTGLAPLSTAISPGLLSRRASQYLRQGKSKEAIDDLNALIKTSPTWSNYLRRAAAYLLFTQPDSLASTRSDNNRQAKIALAIQDCESSLALQKSPDSYRLLTRANLLAGTSQYKDACLASKHLIKASPGSASGLQLQVLAAFMAGDFASAREAIVSYTGAETKMGHSETGHFAGGLMGGLSQSELQIVLGRKLAGVGGADAAGQKILLQGILDFLSHKYELVQSIDKAFKDACAKESGGNKNGGQKGESLALTLAAAADLLCRQPQAAQTKIAIMMHQKDPDLSTCLLLDDAYFALSRREQGLKEIAALAQDRDTVLARAKILDEMSQPQEALKLLQAWTDKNKSKKDEHDQMVLQIAKLDSDLNKNDQAIKNLGLYMARHSQSGEAYFLRAKIYAQKGQFPAALNDLDVAINDGYNLLKAVRARSACYEALGQKGPARDDMNLADSFNAIVP